jgi:Transglycosylase-like domain
LLIERKHILAAGAIAVLAFPAAASAAGHADLAPRVRLHADAPSAAAPKVPVRSDGPSQVRSVRIALGDAIAVSGPLLDPVDRYSRLIATTTLRTAHRQKVHARKHREAKRARQEEEKFARLPGGVTMATLESIAACESGGNPEAVSSDGAYRGKYQFDQGTWESVGGSGDPAAAPEAEQDYRAALLYSEAGSSPWPVCG